ncbi:hypothetical protein P7K49_004633 [Saguinus oedipus]|uniref:Transmembrane protein n=1 Tax=Saguinus oedipus TaxID=9490 RepID=A0ABQ9W7Z3_SAGOE|nr:hypothetical protein P7K49_004633 [Saguinus oedipus]
MTKTNGEEPKMGGRMERFQQGVRKRTLLAKKKVQNITKEDVKSYLFRNAFVLLTVTAVIVATSKSESSLQQFAEGLPEVATKKMEKRGHTERSLVRLGDGFNERRWTAGQWPDATEVDIRWKKLAADQDLEGVPTTSRLNEGSSVFGFQVNKDQ